MRDFVFDGPQQGFSFGDSTYRFQPARRLRQRLAQIPNDQRTQSAEREHGAPAEVRDDERSEECGDGQAAHHDDIHVAKPLAAGLRRDELRHRRVPHDVLGPEADSRDEAQQGQHGHRRSEGGSDGRETEDGEINLIGEAAAVAVSEETGQKGSQSCQQT